MLYTPTMTPLQQAAERLIAQHNGLRAAARAIEISPTYLLKIRDGDREPISAELLGKFGLRRDVQFSEINASGKAIPVRYKRKRKV